MSLTAKQFMRKWPVPEPARMAEIRERVLELADRNMGTDDQHRLVILYRAYSEVAAMIARDYGVDVT